MSLTIFRSRQQGSVIMFEADAQQLCACLNWPAQGQIAAHLLPAFISQLDCAIIEDKRRNPVVWPEDPMSPEDNDTPPVIHFAQRATPLLQLMRRCAKANETITW